MRLTTYYRSCNSLSREGIQWLKSWVDRGLHLHFTLDHFDSLIAQPIPIPQGVLRTVSRSERRASAGYCGAARLRAMVVSISVCVHRASNECHPLSVV